MIYIGCRPIYNMNLCSLILNSVNYIQMQMEIKLLPSTGNHPLNVCTSGGTHAQKCQSPYVYMSAMLE